MKHLKWTSGIRNQWRKPSGHNTQQISVKGNGKEAESVSTILGQEYFSQSLGQGNSNL